MKSPETKEIVKRILVVLLFVLFGFRMPGYATAKGTAVAARRES